MDVQSSHRVVVFVRWIHPTPILSFLQLIRDAFPWKWGIPMSVYWYSKQTVSLNTKSEVNLLRATFRDSSGTDSKKYFRLFYYAFIDIYCIPTYMRTTEHQYVYILPLLYSTTLNLPQPLNLEQVGLVSAGLKSLLDMCAFTHLYRPEQ